MKKYISLISGTLVFLAMLISEKLFFPDWRWFMPPSFFLWFLFLAFLFGISLERWEPKE